VEGSLVEEITGYKIKNVMPKKPYRTIAETRTGRNIRSKNIKTGKKPLNKALISRVKQGKLRGYHVVKPKRGAKYLRSNPDRSRGNNLDR
jgi:hypothetical protein